MVQRFGAWLAGQPAGHVPKGRGVRQYAAARNTRTTLGFGGSSNTSADAELSLSLTQLRARSRQMVRDSAYAKRARTIIINNVVGSGVGIQAQVETTRGQMAERINAGIEREWREWASASSAHTGGAMHFHDLERAALGQVFEAGEVLIRKHYVALGNSRVPLALELIEPERLPDHLVDPGTFATQNEVRMGIEVDGRFQRPVAYWIRERHPGDIRVRVGSTDRYERVPAEDVFHLRIVTRWPQTRGEPWLHAVLTELDNTREFVGLELQAARAGASLFATIETGDENNPIATDEESDGKPVIDMEPLTIQELAPGEKLNLHDPNRPNSALDPFMRYMLRQIAAGIGVSYESLSRDYSQSNYSSSRLALLDDRDLWKQLQQWWVRSFRKPLHDAWLNLAVLSGAVPEINTTQYALDMAKFSAVKFKLRGWQWVDPTKEVTAYKEAIKAGLISTSDVIDQTAGGQDVEDVVRQIARDRDLYTANDILRDTDVPEPTAQPAAAPQAPEAADPEAEEETAAAGARARLVAVRHR